MKNKKGISIVIGYVLLIAVSIVMSIIVYQWLSTYVPTESLECDEGVSLFVTNITYNCLKDQLNITIKNNGRFSLNGYFIHASNKTTEEIATIDLSHNVTDSTGAEIDFEKFDGNAIVFDELKNGLNPGSSALLSFDVSDYDGNLVKIEIIPTRYQEMDGIQRFVSCGNARIEETLTCN